MPRKRPSTTRRRPARLFIKEHREACGLTQEQLADRLDTTKGVISKLESGQQRYNQDWLEELAFALDCHVSELYRPPASLSADEMIARMSPEIRQTAINLLESMEKWEKPEI